MRRIVPILRQWWYRNHPSKDEFAVCYSFDVEYFLDVKKKADHYQKLANKWYDIGREYQRDLAYRRNRVHEEDMKK
jgi:hypothetical protein